MKLNQRNEKKKNSLKNFENNKKNKIKNMINIPLSQKKVSMMMKKEMILTTMIEGQGQCRSSCDLWTP